MHETTFHTTFSTSHFSLSQAKNCYESGFWSAVSYRFGFNGKENDNEVKGIGNQQDYGMRIYDPRLGRFLSVDPLTKSYPWYTPYQFAGNTPIQAVDIDGAEPGYAGKNGELTYAGNTTSFEDGSIDPGNYLWEWTDKGWENRGGAPFLFEGFSAGKVHLQLLARMNDPSKIDQGYSNTCGMAGCAMAMAKHYPKEYAKFVMDLATTGYAKFRNFEVELSDYLTYTENNAFKDYEMPEADWILLVAMRDYENNFLSYGTKNIWWVPDIISGNNFPGEVSNTVTEMGFNTEYNSLDPFHGMAFENELMKIQGVQNRGGTTIMLINSKMLENGTSRMSNHYVVYGGGLVIDEKQKSVQFNVWTWGYNKKVNCSFETFKNNYYGRISIFPK